DSFDAALRWAINACEQARRYAWPASTAIERHSDTRDDWNAANAAAIQLSAAQGAMPIRTMIPRPKFALWKSASG
ncbi:MAG TPA: hypothetical protein VGJ56_28090, partial [Reyranella sp.]